MIVGVPKEAEHDERRVAITPSEAGLLTARGHTVLVEGSAGAASGFEDEWYRGAGATICATAAEVFSDADMVVKVQAPSPQERLFLREGQILLSHLYLAARPELTHALLGSKVIAIACEAVEVDDGARPMVACMDEIAGGLAVQLGAQKLQTDQGGSGVLLAGVLGGPPARVAVVGGGVAGAVAAATASAMGASVTVLESDPARRHRLIDAMPGPVTVLPAHGAHIAEAVAEADLVLGALVGPELKTRPVVTKAMLALMRKGSVVVDLAAEQGGCVEGAVPTPVGRPALDVDGVALICPVGLISAAARTATLAFATAMSPYVTLLADRGWRAALSTEPALARGLKVLEGDLVCEDVARSLDMEWKPWNTPGLQETGA